MSKYFPLAIVITLISILCGCQEQAKDNTIYNEAEEIYLAIENSWSNGEYISESDQEQLAKFNEEYIVNYKDFPSDKNVIMEMEKLINGYQMYYTAIGQDNVEAKDRYNNNVNEALTNLEKEFNK